MNITANHFRADCRIRAKREQEIIRQLRDEVGKKHNLITINYEHPIFNWAGNILAFIMRCIGGY